MVKSITIKQLEEIVTCSEITKRGRTVTFRESFFYRNGGSATKFLHKVEDALCAANIDYACINYAEIEKPFKGGAPISKQSHWFVKIELL